MCTAPWREVRHEQRLSCGRPARCPRHGGGGYLGSGKTTLINGWLQQGACEGWALLVNDLGQINVDAERLRQGDGRVLELGGGCVCCTLRDGLGVALLELAKREQPPFMC